MAFNHYAKIKRILSTYPDTWYVAKINHPTSSKNFKGETVQYEHYYRVYGANNRPIKYCKFQQLDRFAQALSLSVNEVPLIESNL